MNDNASAFRTEAAELLSHLENGLIELEETPEKKELVEPVFRALHTLKGHSKFLGFNDVAGFAHELEAAFEFVRKGQMSFSHDLGKLALHAKDLLRDLVNAHFGDPPVPEAQTADVLRILKAMVDSQAGSKREAVREEIDALLKDLKPLYDALRTDNRDLKIIARTVGNFTKLHRNSQILGHDLGMFIGKFMVALESSGHIHSLIPPELIALAREATDFFPLMLDSADIDLSSPDIDPRIIIESMEMPRGFFARLEILKNTFGFNLEVPQIEGVAQKGEEAAKPVPQKPSREVTYHIIFKPSEAFGQTGLSLTDLEKEAGKLGPISIVQKTERGTAGPAILEAFLTTITGPAGVRDLFLFSADNGELILYLADSGKGSDPALPEKKLGEILIEQGDIDADDLEAVLSKQRQHDEALVKSIEWNQVLQDQKKALEDKKGSPKKDKDTEDSFMRVSLKRLTELVNLIGELVAQKARLLQRAQILENRDLITVAEELGRLIEKLRDGTMINRMKPIGETFMKYDRMMKDLAKELGKEVDLITSGIETELDMATLERLNDPMVHLIRNTVDHGIEAPDAREAQGKPRKGTVKLSAEHSGSMVFIRIEDDGAGLNIEKLTAKAVQKGLVKPDARLSREEVYNLIFLPGFSTAAVVTNISGRGTGMDVVKRVIDSLHGTISIRSEVGKGSVFTLKLPLSLAILEGLLVRVAERHFIFPLTAVEEIVHLLRSEVQSEDERQIKNIRGGLVPYIRLREKFGDQKSSPRDVEQLVICNIDGVRTGFVVDEVVGEHHTLVKNLGSFYRDSVLFSGVTILGDGTLALILELSQLIKGAEQLANSELPGGQAAETRTRASPSLKDTTGPMVLRPKNGPKNHLP